MSGIEDLRQRVQDAEQHFGLAREEQVKYSTRLIGLIDEVEGRIRTQQTEIEQQRAALAGSEEAIANAHAQVSRFEGENEQLRAMLHSLLKAIESGGRWNIAETMHALDQKVTALISGGGAIASATDEPKSPPEPAAEPDAVSELVMEVAPEPEIVSEPEIVEEPKPELVAEPELEPELVAELEAAPEPEQEAVAEPEPQTMADPDAAIEPDPEPIAEPEMVDEVQPEMAPEIIAAPAAEMIAEPNSPEAAEGNAVLVDDIDEAARELAAAPSNTTIVVSDSLHEIMDRVSKLVREADGAEAAAPAPQAKKAAAG